MKTTTLAWTTLTPYEMTIASKISGGVPGFKIIGLSSGLKKPKRPISEFPRLIKSLKIKIGQMTITHKQ